MTRATLPQFLCTLSMEQIVRYKNTAKSSAIYVFFIIIIIILGSCNYLNPIEIFNLRPPDWSGIGRKIPSDSLPRDFTWRENMAPDLLILKKNNNKNNLICKKLSVFF